MQFASVCVVSLNIFLTSFGGLHDYLENGSNYKKSLFMFFVKKKISNNNIRLDFFKIFFSSKVNMRILVLQESGFFIIQTIFPVDFNSNVC